MSILAIEGIDFYYAEAQPIFSNLSLLFPNNQSTALIGQNGSGKTTLAKLLKGLLRPQSGTIYYQQTDLSTLSVAEIARHIGLVFQNPDDQIFKSDVLSEVMFGPINIGFSEKKAKSAAREALKTVGLLHTQAKNPYDLPLSERKFIAVASILAMDPQIIIFDEPTIGQDVSGKKRIQQIIKQLKSKGKLIITIIHDMDFVAENFERTVILANGRILVDADTKTAFAEHETLSAAHLHEPYIMQAVQGLGYKPEFLTVSDFLRFYRQKKQE